ncbi:MAG: hypothetical protein HZB46_00355 [Solirubrobacterales bacterium]|nr:hypothetical protein [Solirubrobacterales bacterium]
MRRGLAVLAAAMLVAVGAASAHAADTLTVDFETGPPLDTPVTDQYKASAFVEFFADDPRYRPYRVSSPINARSGSVVADVGRVCLQENPGGGSDCEFAIGGTYGRMTRTASKVTLFAGLFDGGPITAHLVAYDAAGNPIATGPETPVDAGKFDSMLTVSRVQNDIARFELVPSAGASIGFDDLTFDYPSGTLPAMSLSGPANPVTVLQGKTLDVPVNLTRINGSNGNADLSITGLPPGVTAQLVPDPIPGTVDDAIVRLTGAPNAPGLEQPATATLKADPKGNAAVAPAARSIQILIRVASNYELRAEPGATGVVPTCATFDLPFSLARDRTFTGTVTLTLDGVPAGVSAEILPGTTIAPGGGFTVGGTIRLTGSPTRAAAGTMTLKATSPGAPERTLALPVVPATGTATLDRTFGLTPRRLQPGTPIHLSGNGFCPGTRVQLGNAVADVTLDTNNLGLTFNVPRLAADGPVRILPPGTQPAFTTTNPIDVESFRSRNSFPFANYGFGHLSITELTDAFGADDLFIKVNPCWPWGSCTIVTGILNPIAALSWGVLDIMLHESGGHCFGFSHAVQELTTGKERYTRFASVSAAIDLPNGPSGPSGSLGDWLDAQHALQGSGQFLTAWGARDDTVAGQLDRLRGELAANRDAIVSLSHGSGFDQAGHAMLAYDLVPAADGGQDILVYDSNRPFLADERTQLGTYAARENASAIHINPDGHGWSFNLGSETWTGGDDGKMFIAKTSDIPDNPSLAGISDAADVGLHALFGSDGSVKTTDATKGTELLPALDPNAPPGAAGALIAPNGARTLSQTFQGSGSGTYSQVVTGPGFASSIDGVRTGAGVKDEVSSGNGKVTFDSGQSRTLELSVARAGGGAAARAAALPGTVRAATVRTTAAKGGSDAVEVARGGGLEYRHEGAATSYTFTLTSAQLDGGATTFTSPRLRAADGDRVTVKPLRTSDLSRVRVTVRRKSGRRTSAVLRSRVTGPRLTLGAAKVRGRTATVRVRVRGVRDQAVLGVALRVRRGAKLVATRTRSVARAANGTQTLTFRLPKLAKGRYRLLVDGRLVGAGARATATTARKASSLRVR